jgi:hypothetical protein
MVKYIITKEIEVDESDFECEQIGVFDTEKEAVSLADSIHAEMNEFERYYYEIIVWKAIGDSIDTDDWETFTECYSVAMYPAEVDEAYEEQFDSFDNNELTDPETTIHYCLSPVRDGFRLWVGEDPSKYVDGAFDGKNSCLAFGLADWYKQYGQFAERDWKECFPERNREMYLKHITLKGYSDEEALDILRYLPQTVSDEIPVNTSKMIELWKAKAPIAEPYRTPLWKKMILQGTKDLWVKKINSVL